MTCERCWTEASRRALLGGGMTAELYRIVLAENDDAHRECVRCGGEGWYADHSDACWWHGACVGGAECPVQRPCDEHGGDHHGMPVECSECGTLYDELENARSCAEDDRLAAGGAA